MLLILYNNGDASNYEDDIGYVEVVFLQVSE